MRINAVLVAIRATKPSTRFGQPALVALQSTLCRGLFRTAIPADIPSNAVVTKADIVVTVAKPLTGSRTVSARRFITTTFAGAAATWNNQPTNGGAIISATVGAVAKNTEIRIDAQPFYQAFIAGTLPNYGFLLYTSDATRFDVHGVTAAGGKPYLDLEYLVPGDAPTGLSPAGGAVSVEKPTLTFDVPDDTVAIRVLVDPDADDVTPAWDSGEVAATAGQLVLADTSYPGLALNAETAWAAYAKTSQGWSPLSDWAEFSRVAKPAVAITSPGATTGDKTPPITWTAAGQTAWHVFVRDASGKILATSGLIASGDHEWTPTTALTRLGQVADIIVRVYDAVDRVATPGDPPYTQVKLTTQLVTAGAEPGVDNLTAGLVGVSPVVRLTWQGPVSDEIQIVRNGKLLERIDGSRHSYYDWTATPRRKLTYKVLRVSDGVMSPNGPSKTITPSPGGVWLMDVDDAQMIQILGVGGADAFQAEMPEQAVLHNVLDGPPVRRRLGMPPPKGRVSGTMVDARTNDASAMYDLAMVFKGNPAGQVYRLVYLDWTIPVTIGDLSAVPYDVGRTGRAYTCSFDWWQTGDELPWDD